ncbi:MAG: metal ABC transporter permease, partial [Eubacteriales bacterium]
LTAVTISVSARTVGTLVVSSLMVLPVASAMQIAKSYRQTLIYSVILALFFTVSGLYISFYANFKPGGSIVLVGVLVLMLILAVKNVLQRSTRKMA